MKSTHASLFPTLTILAPVNPADLFTAIVISITRQHPVYSSSKGKNNALTLKKWHFFFFFFMKQQK